jgi:hypothetical protein
LSTPETGKRRDSDVLDSRLTESAAVPPHPDRSTR